MTEHSNPIRAINDAPSMLADLVARIQSVDETRAVRISFSHEGASVFWFKGHDWELDESIDKNSHRLNEAYEVAGLFGWSSDGFRDQTWPRVTIGAKAAVMRVRLLPAATGKPELFISCAA